MNTAIKLARAHFKLDFPKPMWLMLLIGAVMCAPNYPRIVAVMCMTMMIGSLLGIVRETRSEELFLTLPIRRRDAVKGQALFTSCIQLIYLSVCALFAVVALFIPFFGQPIAQAQPGIPGNIAFFGIALFSYGMFNLAFFPLYYCKGGATTPTSLFVACIVAILSAIGPYGIFEALAQTVPQVGGVLLSFDSSTLAWQLLMLFCGILLYVGLTAAGTSLAIKRYERGN